MSKKIICGILVALVIVGVLAALVISLFQIADEAVSYDDTTEEETEYYEPPKSYTLFQGPEDEYTKNFEEGRFTVHFVDARCERHFGENYVVVKLEYTNHDDYPISCANAITVSCRHNGTELEEGNFNSDSGIANSVIRCHQAEEDETIPVEFVYRLADDADKADNLTITISSYGDTKQLVVNKPVGVIHWSIGS